VRILCLGEPDVVDFYRGRGPLQMSADFTVKEVMRPEEIHFSDARGCDVVYMPRPHKPEHVEVLQEFARWGTKIWVDYDDLLTHLPFSNPAYHQFRGCSSAIRSAIELSDVVTCSTALLAEKFGGKVINNAVMFAPREMKAKHSSVAWRGSASHAADIDAYRSALPVNVSVHSLGHLPWQFVNEGHEVFHKPTSAISKYWEALSLIESHVLVVPLVDDVFNRCKSNIAALEAWSAGMIPVVPHWPEWRDLSPFTYTDKKSFKEATAAALKAEPSDFVKRREAILAQYSLDEMNALRKEVLCGSK